MIVCGPLDRERISFYRLNLILRNNSQEVIFDHPIHLDIIDVNDNSPVWNQTHYHIAWNWHRKHNAFKKVNNDIRLIASDADERENARLRYSIQGTNLFSIDHELGFLTITDQVFF